MSLLLIEKVVDDIKGQLSANMPAKLLALNAAYGSSITLEEIKAYYVAEQAAIPEFPAILVLGDSTKPSDESDGWMNSNHQLTLVVLATDQNEQNLKRRLYRYVRAIIELMITARTNLGIPIFFQDIHFSPMYGGKAGSFISDASVVITCRKGESV